MIYVVTRYVGLASQMYVRFCSLQSALVTRTRCVLIDLTSALLCGCIYFLRWMSRLVYIPNNRHPVPSCICGRFTHASSYVLLQSIPQSLAHPQSLVYALFLHDRLILVILILFAVSQVASMGVSAGLSIPSNRHMETCLLLRSNPGLNAFLIIFFMTFWRYLRLPTKWTRMVVVVVTLISTGSSCYFRRFVPSK